MSTGEYDISRRAPCVRCKGIGGTWSGGDADDGGRYTPCPECAGTGVPYTMVTPQEALRELGDTSSTADECEGNLLTAHPEGHWVHVGQQWINMALVYSVEPGSEGWLDLYVAGAGYGGGALPIELANAGPLLAYLEAHEAHSHSHS